MSQTWCVVVKRAGRPVMFREYRCPESAEKMRALLAACPTIGDVLIEVVEESDTAEVVSIPFTRARSRPKLAI